MRVCAFKTISGYACRLTLLSRWSAMFLLSTACGGKKDVAVSTAPAESPLRPVTNNAGTPSQPSKAKEGVKSVSIDLSFADVVQAEGQVSFRLAATVKGSGQQTVYGCKGGCPPGVTVEPVQGNTVITLSGLESASRSFTFQAVSGDVSTSSVFHLQLPLSDSFGLPACSNSVSTGCAASAQFPAVDATLLTPQNIRAGVVLGGRTGVYPSVLAPLANNTQAADLTAFDSSLSPGVYEFFDSLGTRYSGSVSDAPAATPGTTAQSIPATSSLFRSFSVAGDANLVATKILKDVALFGVTGSVVAKPGDCSLDGATNCVATSQYPAAKVADVAPTDLRSGKTLGGVEGTLPACSTTSQDGCVTSQTVTALVLTELGNVIPCGSTFAGYTNPCLPGEWLFHPMVAANASSVTDGPGADYELGVEVRFKQPGSITKIRAYKALGEDGTHKARIWKAGQKVLEVDLPVIGALSGWMEVMLPTPYVVDQLAVDNAEIFTISSSINSHYPSVPATPWQTFSFPHVEFPFSYGANRAAVYNETPDNFPANSSMYSQANYLVDFAFTADP